MIKCCCCSKQILRDGEPSRFDRFVTKLAGSRAGVAGEVFCGYCSEDLDENGLFPEEWCQLTLEERNSYSSVCNCGEVNLSDSLRYHGPRGRHTRVKGEECYES